MSDVIVVGAGGTLGARLARHLGARGVEARCRDPRDTAPLEEVSDARVVVHAGGPRVRPGLDWADYFREHVGLTSRVVRAMRPGSHLVHVSSTAVYGASRGVRLGPESPEAPVLFPSAHYACAKLAAETAARALGAQRGIAVTVVRPSMVYGPSVDSALESLRRLSARGVSLRLAPRALRQHLVHVDLLLALVERCASVGPFAERLLVAADPFVLTNGDLELPGVPVWIPTGAAASAQRAWARAMPIAAPLSLDALAVLAADNTFDGLAALRATGLDAATFARERTFDPYWRPG